MNRVGWQLLVLLAALATPGLAVSAELVAISYADRAGACAVRIELDQPAAATGQNLPAEPGGAPRFFVDVAGAEAASSLLAGYALGGGVWSRTQPCTSVTNVRMSPRDGGQWRVVLDLAKGFTVDLRPDGSRVWVLETRSLTAGAEPAPAEPDLELSFEGAAQPSTPEPVEELPPSPAVAARVDGVEPPTASEPDEEILVRGNMRESSAGANRKIVIDPGHGGEEPGAPGVEGSHEADVVLELSHMVTRLLEQRGYVVVMTREEDRKVSLRERSSLANAEGAALFLSIHANSAESSRPWGIETYYLDNATDAAAARLAARENAALGATATMEERILRDLLRSGNVDRSRALAHAVHDTAVHQLEAFYGEELIRDLGVKTALFAVLVGAEMPAILLEIGFISNPQEGRRLRSRGFKNRWARAIADAIDAFLGEDGS